MIAITVIVTVYTAGAAASLMGVGAGGFAGGAAVLSGAAGLSWATVGAAFIGGMVGSAVGQVAGKEMGIVESFSLRNTVASGLTAAAASAVGSYVHGGAVDAAEAGVDAAKYAKNSNEYLAAIQKAKDAHWLSNPAVVGARSALGGYAAHSLTGNDPSFSWESMVASAAGSYAGHYIGKAAKWAGAGDFGSSLIGGTAGGYAAARLDPDDNAHAGQIAVDVFGNLVANSIVDSIEVSDRVSGLTSDERKLFDNLRGIGKLDAKSALAIIDGTGTGNVSDLSLVDASLSSPRKFSASPDVIYEQATAEVSYLDSIKTKVVLDEVSSENAPGVTQETITEAQERLGNGDRVGAYLALYEATGNEQLLVQAQITSYTGAWGGSALTGNYLAKFFNQEDYDLSLDKFSFDITAATVELYDKMYKKYAESGVMDSNAVTADMLQDSDRSVWERHGLEDFFPGNAQMADFYNHDNVSAFLSPGSLAGMGAYVNGSVFGKRPAEYAGNPNYRVMDSGGRFIQVIDNESGLTEAFWDKEASTMGVPIQVENEALPVNGLTYQKRLSMYEFMQANQSSTPGELHPAYNPKLWRAGGKPMASPNVYGHFYFDQSAGWQEGDVTFDMPGIDYDLPANWMLPSAPNSDALNLWRNSMMDYRESIGLPATPEDRIKR